LPIAGLANPGTGTFDGELAQEIFSLAVEHLDAMVAAVGDIDVALRVGRDRAAC